LFVAAMPVSITPRLRQMLLLLGSDQPGEVAAVVAAISRVLAKSGASWHDLVDRLDRPRPKSKSATSDADDDFSDWRAMRDFCLTRRDRLRERELEFLQNLGHWRGDLTEKQAGWLAAINARLRR
jgi:hypothetical protein